MRVPILLIAWLAAGCDDNRGVPPDPPDAACVPAEPAASDCSDPCFDARGPELRLELAVEELGLPAPPPGSIPIRIGVFYTVAPQAAFAREIVANQMRQSVEDTNGILAQCNLHVVVEAAHVVALPARLLDIEGNEPGSFGGHPPPGTPDPDLFDYEHNERLTAESRELFEYGKRYTSKNAIAAFTMKHITYYANQQLAEAGGLSYPPNIYHHVDDYPYRNAVLLVPSYGACGELPGVPQTRTLAHELGHMLLNTGGHSTLFRNLMNDGTGLTVEQCATMVENLTALYGDAEVPDPGPPGS